MVNNGFMKEHFLSPRFVLGRAGKIGARCFADYQCASSRCDTASYTCAQSSEKPIPVYDYQALNDALYEIALRNWQKDKQLRPKKTFQTILQADATIPYATIVSVMDAMRCRLANKAALGTACLLPADTEAVTQAQTPADPTLAPLYDVARKRYNPDTDALFHDIAFSPGFRNKSRTK